MSKWAVLKWNLVGTWAIQALLIVSLFSQLVETTAQWSRELAVDFMPRIVEEKSASSGGSGVEDFRFVSFQGRRRRRRRRNKTRDVVKMRSDASFPALRAVLRGLQRNRPYRSIGLPCGKGQPNKRAVFARAWRCCIEGTARCLENLWRMQTPLPSCSDEWFEAPEGVTFHHCWHVNSTPRRGCDDGFCFTANNVLCKQLSGLLFFLNIRMFPIIMVPQNGWWK